MSTEINPYSNELLDGYTTYLKCMGYRIVRTPSSLWFTVRRRVYQPAFPFHSDPRQANEATEVLHQGQALACRWFKPSDKPPGETNAGETIVFVVRPPYGLTRLQSKARNQTRRGLERVRVQRMPFGNDIENQAFPVYADNVRRLGLFRSEAEIQNQWMRWVNALRNSPVLTFWGAWQEDSMVAYSVTAKTPWGLEILCQRSLAAALGIYPNNALVFSIVNSAFDEGEPLVSYGLSEFGSDKSSLDHFKKGMAFEELRLQEHFHWHAALRVFSPLLTSNRLHAIARLLRHKRKSHS